MSGKPQHIKPSVKLHDYKVVYRPRGQRTTKKNTKTVTLRGYRNRDDAMLAFRFDTRFRDFIEISVKRVKRA